MRSKFFLALVATGLVLASTDCADFHRGHAPLDGGQGGDGSQIADLAFEKLVYPILELDCADCHSASGEASNSNYVLTGNAQLDRPMVVALVTPGNPANSRLLTQATSNSHNGGVRFATASVEYQTIASWILGLGQAAP
jgi:hypothetical protein